jgi:signal transduction histidine kinase
MALPFFNPNEVDKNSMAPKVFLTDLKVHNQPVTPGQKSVLKAPVYETGQVTLPYYSNNVSIEFTALHYSNPSNNTISYQLENYDNEWRNAGSQHIAVYQNLPPGDYVFRVKAANDKGVWNEKGATLTIIIELPWWRTTPAYVLYVLLIAYTAFLVNRYLRNRLLQKEREKNQERELEQAKEIEKAYHQLEKAHAVLKSTQAQLIQSEKMASLGQLTAGVAHEIQNPLNFVTNFSEVSNDMLDELKEQLHTGNLQLANETADDLKQNLDKIKYHGKRADAIVKGMLQHSRVSTGQKDLTDINKLADEYLRLAYHGRRAKDKLFNAAMQTDFDDSIGKINMVPQDIGRMLLNLFNNAFYAVNEKLTAHRSPLTDDYKPLVSVQTKKISTPSGDGGIEIRVVDNGNGIPQNIIDKIFQPFFTTKPSGQGTGLGLSLAYDIIKAHGGEIKVETKEGEGSEFVVTLPR